MAFGSPKGRRHRAKGWRKRKYGYGELRHPKWAKGPAHAIARRMRAWVSVWRLPAESWAKAGRKPYGSQVCIGTRGQTKSRARMAWLQNKLREQPRLAARCGGGRGKSPTAAIRAALRDLSRSFK